MTLSEVEGSKLMELNKLPKITTKKKKRLGRGYGSGKGGHTVGRGAKGAKARGKIPLTFEGTKIKKSLLKRLPLQRGKGKFKPLKPSLMIVNLKYLNILPKNSLVNIETLIKHGIVKEKEAKEFGVKILGDGELKIPLKVELPCSKGAVKKIEKAGGKVVTQKRKENKSAKIIK
jgi:large subunit ribosomal protein L15